MMEGMIEKGTKDKNAEEVQFAEYKSFCENTAGQKKTAIEEANEMIDKLKADVAKYTSDANHAAKLVANWDLLMWDIT